MKLIVEILGWEPADDTAKHKFLGEVFEKFPGVPRDSQMVVTVIGAHCSCTKLYRCRLDAGHRGVCTLNEVSGG